MTACVYKMLDLLLLVLYRCSKLFKHVRSEKLEMHFPTPRAWTWRWWVLNGFMDSRISESPGPLDGPESIEIDGNRWTALPGDQTLRRHIAAGDAAS